MRMTVREVPREAETYHPFDWQAGGFTESWWDEPVTHSEDCSYDHFTFWCEGAEAVRVMAEPGSTLNPVYDGLNTGGVFVDVTFIEVREDLRGRGLGREAVEWLAGRYAGETMIAFSEGADEFWQSIGWTYYPRSDREDQEPWHHYRPLFVSR